MVDTTGELTSRRAAQLPLLAIAAALVLPSASGESRLNQPSPCAAGPGLCYSGLVSAGPLINTKNFDGGPSLSEDGLTLLLGPHVRTASECGLGEADLYVTVRASANDRWGPPRNLGANVNSRYFDGQPSISADGKTLFWDSARPDGLGDFDIWTATRDTVGGSFRSAVNVGPHVNTVGPEFGPAINQDERQLFFSSGRPGNKGQVDIWVVERKTKSDSWGTAINIDTLNSPFFQAMPTFRGNGSEVCLMAVRPDGFGELDVWCASRLR